jgi:hypothetical protein
MKATRGLIHPGRKLVVVALRFTRLQVPTMAHGCEVGLLDNRRYSRLLADNFHPRSSRQPAVQGLPVQPG